RHTSFSRDWSSDVCSSDLSTKSRKQSNEEVAESRVDYISDHLGIVREEVLRIINLLCDEKILADTKDLTAYIKKGESKNRSINRSEERRVGKEYRYRKTNE